MSFEILLSPDGVFPVWILTPGLLILGILLSILLHLARKYIGRKKYPQAFFFASAVIICVLVYLPAGRSAMITAGKNQEIPHSPLPTDPGPPQRDYPFLKNHQLIRNRERRMIQAVDDEKFLLCLVEGDPLRVYGESFTIMMGKEDVKFTDDREMAEYAKFIVLLANSESEPLFPVDGEELGRFLSRRKDSRQQETGRFLVQAVNMPGAVGLIPTPLGDEWDLPGEVVPFDSPHGIMVARRISPPRFEKDWEGGVYFLLYSFSLRYNELIEWQFRVFEDGRVDVRQPFIVMPGNESASFIPAGEGD